jgi:hypothetical protein
MKGFCAVTIINIIYEQAHEHYQLRRLNLEIRNVMSAHERMSDKLNLQDIWIRTLIMEKHL